MRKQRTVRQIAAMPTRTVAVVAAVAWLALVASCGDSGSSDVGSANEINAPEDPIPAALTPCPAGWRSVAGTEPDDTVTCEPWPEAGHQSCTTPWAHFLGKPACERVGSDCPLGDWADDLPANGSILYVRPGEPAGGAGTVSSPYGTLNEAVANSSAGSIIALAKGDYDEVTLLPGGVTLWGACVQQTVVGPFAAGTEASLGVTSGDVAVRNLRISSPRPALLVDGANPTLHLSDVVIDAAQVVGLLAFNGATVTGSRVVIRDTAPLSGTMGQAIEAGNGAHVDLSEVLLESNHYTGVLAHGAGTLVRLSNVAIRNTDSEPADGGFGRAVSAHLGGRVELVRAVLEGNREISAFADQGGELLLEQAVVRDTQPSRDQPDNGFGVGVLTGAHLEMRSVFLHRNRAFGIYAGESTVDLVDVVVRQTLEMQQSATNGNGILVGAGSTVTATRLTVEHNKGAGVQVEGLGTTFVARDVVARDTDGQMSDGFEGQGIAVLDEATLQLDRALLERNQCGALVADGAGTVGLFRNITIRGTRGCAADGIGGRGLVVQLGADVTAERFLVEGNRTSGIFVARTGTQLMLTDAVVRNTRGDEDIGVSGDGLHAQEGATVSVDRALFEGNHEAGIFAAGAWVVGTEVTVHDIFESECSPSVCLSRAGIGVIVALDGYVSLNGFSLAHNAMAGIAIADEGSADLTDGEITDNPIAVSIQNPAFDARRLDNSVDYRGNGVRLDSSFLPLPTPIQSP